MGNQNHVIDPSFFYDAIEEFAFDYNAYFEKSHTIDERGNKVVEYDHKVVRGSLQSQGVVINHNKSGNIQEMRYNFYCKSLYRLEIGDIIRYKNRLLSVDSVQDYDEWGVRKASLIMVELAKYKDLTDYIKYLEGEKIV